MRFNVPVLALEGSPTADGRLFDRFDWRELPLPLMLQDTGAHGGEAGPSLVAGLIESIARGGDGGAVTAVIDTDDDGEAGAEAARLIQEGILTGISVDYSWADTDVEFECTDEDEDGWCLAMTIHWTLATIMGATIVPFPAFAEARIDPTPLDAEEADPAPAEAAAARVASLSLPGAARPPAQPTRTAAVDYPTGPGHLVAAASLVRPPAEWFEDPKLAGPTRLTVTDDGRVYGHVAFWDACHVSFPDRCVPPPRSTAGYPHFHTGTRLADGNVSVRTGPLVVGTDHAPTTRGITADEAVDHYAHSGCAWADVVARDDAYGIAVAGALRPGVTDEQLVAVRASAPSGDWRPVNGRHELVAVLQVNTPGFRDALAASASEVLTASANAVIIVTPGCGECEAEAAESPAAATIRRVRERATRDALRARLRVA